MSYLFSYSTSLLTSSRFLNLFVASTVVESHPDNSHSDLRLDRPFSTLVQYVDALDLSKMTKQVCAQQVYS